MSEQLKPCHELKAWPCYFQPLWTGKKSFELRVNDRNFQVGDKLLIREFDPDTSVYTGMEFETEITYVLESPRWLRKGVCALGFCNFRRKDLTRPPQNSGAPMTQTFQDELSEKRIGEILKKILWPVHKQKLGWRHHKLMVGEEKALIIQFHKIFATPQPSSRVSLEEILKILETVEVAYFDQDIETGIKSIDWNTTDLNTAKAILSLIEGKDKKENPSVGFMGETL